MKKYNHTLIRYLALGLIALLVMLPLAACGAASDSAGNMSAGDVPAQKDEAFDGMEVAPEGGAALGSGSSSDDLYERKIIRTVNLSCETKTYDEAVNFLLSVLSAHGGYVESSSVSGTGFREGDIGSYSARYATYTLRVPAEQLDAYLLALTNESGIRIVRQSSNSDEITSTYYDIATRIDTLKTERDALNAMLAGFTDYKDIGAMLSVQERLYNVIEEIEALQTQLNIYDSRVDMSTVQLTLQEVITYTQAAAPTFGERMGDAFSESWLNFADGCQDFAVGLVYALPTILVLAVIAAVVILIVWRLTARSRKARRQSEKIPTDHESGDKK